MGSEATARTAATWSCCCGFTCCCCSFERGSRRGPRNDRKLGCMSPDGYLAAETLVEAPEAGVLEDRHRRLPDICMDASLRSAEIMKGERGGEVYAMHCGASFGPLR